MSDVNFWVEDPCELFSSWAILPTTKMSKQEKLNALTRLVLVTAVIMYALKYDMWLTFLILALLLLVVLNYGTKEGTFEGYKKDEPYSHHTDVKDEDKDDGYVEMLHEQDNTAETQLPSVEHFSVTPTYTGTDFNQTVVPPTYAEEWQIPPPAYDLYTNVPYPDSFETPLRPQSYPYGQYLTKTNLLPSDEYYTHLGCGGARSAREYANSAFLRHDLARRENLTRIYKKKLARRYRHNGSNDVFSPFTSY